LVFFVKWEICKVHRGKINTTKKAKTISCCIALMKMGMSQWQDDKVIIIFWAVQLEASIIYYKDLFSS
jgi:UDP-N-acetylmuramyl pentapeptide phosphotransferase/UDP-N-acetylglucosamine-1-phosphate transferase